MERKLEDLFYFGLGAATLAREQFRNIGQEFEQARNAGQDEKERFVNDTIERGREARTEMHDMVHDAVKEVIAELDLATRADLERTKEDILAAVQRQS